MFINREEEISIIRRRINSNNPEMIIIYGRRGIGKTTLLFEALKDSKKVYLFTPRGDLKDILESYSRDIREELGFIVNLASWQDFLEFLLQAGKHGIVVIIDEFQRLSEAYPPGISFLQDFWDRKLKKTKIKLILVGSIIGMVEKLALMGDAPLFGRKTSELKIQPLPYIAVRDYWRSYSEEERIAAYGVFGGTPNYFVSANPNSSLEENILDLILSKDGKLFREPENLLNEETRAPATYISILSLLSRSGRGLPLSKIHVRRGSPTVYLNTLIKMDLVEKIKSLAQYDTIYSIKDEFFRFWFYFIHRRMSLIEMGKGKVLLEYIMSEIDNYLAFTFEKILRELIIYSSGNKLKGKEIPIIYEVGSFWYKDIEIDVAALAEDILILGEAKWRDEKIERKEVEKFIAKANLAVKKKGMKGYIGIILSKEGFTISARKLEGDNLILIDLEELAREIKELRTTLVK